MIYHQHELQIRRREKRFALLFIKRAMREVEKLIREYKAADRKINYLVNILKINSAPQE